MHIKEGCTRSNDQRWICRFCKNFFLFEIVIKLYTDRSVCEVAARGKNFMKLPQAATPPSFDFSTRVLMLATSQQNARTSHIAVIKSRRRSGHYWNPSRHHVVLPSSSGLSARSALRPWPQRHDEQVRIRAALAFYSETNTLYSSFPPAHTSLGCKA